MITQAVFEQHDGFPSGPGVKNIPLSSDGEPRRSEESNEDPASAQSPATTLDSASPGATRRHLRGSGLLLAGRLLALGTNFLVHVLIVRYLSKSDYGAFAYALTIVALGACVNLAGLQRAVSRFVPLYHERRDYGAMFGTIFLALGSITGLGLALVALTFGLRGLAVDYGVINDPNSVGLLLILIALCPLQALDNVFQSVAAALASPRAIFFRRHVLGPALKLTAVLIVLFAQGSVYLLAWCYLGAGFIGVMIYVLLIRRVVRDNGLHTHLERRTLRFPAREIFSFSVPLLTADVAVILKTTIAVLILGSLPGSTGVAEFRVVLPIAGLNLVVLQSLKLLFTPVATRLFERKDTPGLNALYWQSALWITIVTFPVFGVCVFLAEPLTVFLFQDKYANDGVVLAILAAGTYFNAAMGLNTYTLQVYSRVGFLAFSNVFAVLLALILNLWLIPGYGATGAAIATTGAVVFQNILNHAGLRSRTDIALFEWRHWKVYTSVVTATLALLLVRVFVAPPVFVLVTLLAVVSLLLVRINRQALAVGETFPELKQVPLLRNFLSLGERR